MAGQFGILTFDFTCWQAPGAFFEKVISVADEIQQVGSIGLTSTGSVMVVRGVAI